MTAVVSKNRDISRWRERRERGRCLLTERERDNGIISGGLLGGGGQRQKGWL